MTVSPPSGLIPPGPGLGGVGYCSVTPNWASLSGNEDASNFSRLMIDSWYGSSHLKSSEQLLLL